LFIGSLLLVGRGCSVCHGEGRSSRRVTVATLTAVEGLDRLAGRARDLAAVQLARRIAENDVPIVPYGAPHIGLLLGPQLGCRRFDAYNFALDLTTLCLTS